MGFSEIVGLIPAEKQGEAKAFIEAYQKSAIVRPKDRAEVAKLFEGEELFKAELDSRVSRAVTSHDEKIKREIVPGLVEAELKKRNPEKSTAEKAVDELSAKLASMEEASKRKDQKLRAIAKLQAEGIPHDLIDGFVGLTDDETDGKIEGYVRTFKAYGDSLIEKTKKELIGNGAPSSGKAATGKKTMTRTEWKALQPADQAKVVKEYEIID